jgi:CRISPR system Cascade subunit CasE
MPLTLSRLVLDPRDRAARRDVANPYAMHQTLARVFAEHPDAPPARFLWRLEPGGPFDAPTVLIQSVRAGNWERLPPRYGRVQSKPYDPARLLQTGRELHFRLYANPTRVLKTEGEPARRGLRVGIHGDGEVLAWLATQGQSRSGFALCRLDHAVTRPGNAFWHDADFHTETESALPFDVQVRCTRWRFRKAGADANGWITFDVAHYEGRLQVTDPVRLAATIETGIGRGKAFGLGLLSLAP